MSTNYIDHHHLLYPRTGWNYGFAKKLRTHAYLIVELPRNLHEAIHASVPYIPVASGNVSSAAIEKLAFLRETGVIKGNDSPVKRLSALIGIFEELDPDIAYALDAQLKIVCKFNSLH